MIRAEKWPTTQRLLLEGLRDPRNAEAWRVFVDIYGPPVYHFCRRHRLQDADACDVTQQVFAALGRAFPNFEFDPQVGKFRSWLGAVVANAVRRFYRQVQRGRVVTDEPAREALLDDKVLEAEWVEIFNRRLLECALERIRGEFDADSWQAFEGLWTKRQSAAEIARQLGRTPKWIYQAKYLVLKRLEEEVHRLSDDLSVLHR